MKIETSTCQVYTVSGVQTLDPITVFVQEFENALGRIVVHCWGKAWSCFFNHGCNSILEFVSTLGVDYLSEKLGRYHEVHRKGVDGKKDRAYLERIYTAVIQFARVQIKQ